MDGGAVGEEDSDARIGGLSVGVRSIDVDVVARAAAIEYARGEGGGREDWESMGWCQGVRECGGERRY